MKIKSLSVLFLMLLSLTYCGRKRNAIGGTDDIYVFASDTMKVALEQAIDTTFSYGIRTPEFQRYFHLKWKPIADFWKMRHYRNCIVLVNLQERDLGYDIVKTLLTPENFSAVEKDSLHIFAFEDGWALGQMTVLIVGNDIQRMRQNILEQQGWLFNHFDRKFEEVQGQLIYSQFENTKLSKQLWDRYHWTMRIQRDYVLVKELPQQNFVWIGRGLPYRWVSVTWAAGQQISWLTANGLFAKRQEIGKFYGDNVTDQRFLGFHYIKFGQYDALRMYGLWYMEHETKGGPFATYAFYDRNTDRTFIIDLLLFAPGEKVTIAFRGMEIMAKSFTTDYHGSFGSTTRIGKVKGAD